MTFSTTKGKDQSSRVETQKAVHPVFPMRPRPLSVLLDGSGPSAIFGRWRLNLIVHVIQTVERSAVTASPIRVGLHEVPTKSTPDPGSSPPKSRCHATSDKSCFNLSPPRSTMLVSLFQGVLCYGKHRTIRQEGSELLASMQGTLL
jgi:hypothetical protein